MARVRAKGAKGQFVGFTDRQVFGGDEFEWQDRWGRIGPWLEIIDPKARGEDDEDNAEAPLSQDEEAAEYVPEEAAPNPPPEETQVEVTLEEMTPAQLREWIKERLGDERAGENPHPATGKVKLLAKAQELLEEED